MKLTMKRKAELFDILAANLKEAKINDDWIYHDRKSPVELARLIEHATRPPADDFDGEY